MSSNLTSGGGAAMGGISVLIMGAVMSAFLFAFVPALSTFLPNLLK